MENKKEIEMKGWYQKSMLIQKHQMIVAVAE
jgi:hypothetical protein